MGSGTGIKLEAGMPHTLPADLRKAIISVPKVKALWDDISPLARNEWICWVISGKKAETRDIRIEKALSKMKGGMRRPCCWIGCVHRADKPISASQKYVLGKLSKKRS
jgi:uncharacterized protein YdeI (YjbR/CyaY-like superfamily)